MPYTRPDRKGLPIPPEEDEEELPRSESYLHLSDLGSESNTSQNASTEQSPEASNSKTVPRKAKGVGKKPPELTPPAEVSHENSPSKPSTPYPEKSTNPTHQEESVQETYSKSSKLSPKRGEKSSPVKVPSPGMSVEQSPSKPSTSSASSKKPDKSGSSSKKPATLSSPEESSNELSSKRLSPPVSPKKVEKSSPGRKKSVEFASPEASSQAHSPSKAPTTSVSPKKVEDPSSSRRKPVKPPKPTSPEETTHKPSSKATPPSTS